MKKFNVDEAKIITEIKHQLERFISNSKSLNANQKIELKKELGSAYSHDERFKVSKELLENALGYSAMLWKEENLDCVSLWKSVVIENAKINNKPQEVADEVLKSFIKKFTID